ncbi:MAG TPA: Asp-tRNA(Asn)/Glu-tRNA(Gln) amidotransferase subunit GatC [Vicinamibacterales bacterium]|nr:Asp-tRNA(Asn)/Glu-tRNA(Gln) amidotransferase subunit GatC [Vicinamibacterales bacterium]
MLRSPVVPDGFAPDEIERLAELARLALTADERALFARQLGDILAFAAHIRSVDTTGVPATSHPAGVSGALREDLVRPSLNRGDALAQAPDADTAAGLFKVPRVFER